ncbi:MAG: D-glycero-alpha-D-manno-heptose-1,7-bisphosphate 7-phosphatase [Verrucomicrobiota bacterium]
MKAVFFDRDDTIIYNVPHNGDPSKVRLMPDARECLEKLQQAGFELFIVSNQSAVGRGWITKEQVDAVNAEMLQQLGKPFFKKIYLCYSAPEDPYAERRKPSPAMILEARNEFSIDLTQSFIVGDRLADVECGLNAGCRSVLIALEENDETQEARKRAHFTAKTLAEATDWILGQG